MEWFSRNKTLLIGLGLSILSAVVRFLAVNQTSHPTGWDGYYYVMQVHSWITYGHLQSPDFSLIYPFLTGITLIVGDFILGFKIGVAMLSGMLIGAVFFYLHKRSVPLVWICIACGYLIFSPLTTYFLMQFPKNTLGLIFLILFVHFTSVRWAAFLFLAATVLTHRMTGGFAVIGVAMYLFRSVSWKWIAGGAAAVAAVGFLPGIIHISDLQRFSGQFTWMPQWAPLSYQMNFNKSLSVWFMADLALITIFSLTAFWLLIKNRRQLSLETLIWIPVALIAVFPFFEFYPGAIAQRFFLVAPVAFIMIMQFKEPPKLTWAVVPIILIISLFSHRSYRPRVFDPPNLKFTSIAGRLTKYYDPNNYPLVVAHKSLAEIIIFRTDFDALNWLPPEDMDSTHVLRLITGVIYSDFREYLDDADVKQIRMMASGYLAAPEVVWQKFVKKVKAANDKPVLARIFRNTNPMEARPYFLNKGKK